VEGCPLIPQSLCLDFPSIAGLLIALAFRCLFAFKFNFKDLKLGGLSSLFFFPLYLRWPDDPWIASPSLFHINSFFFFMMFHLFSSFVVV